MFRYPRYLLMRFTPSIPVSPCRLVARAAAAALALDASVEKPPAAGCSLGLPWITRIDLAMAVGAAYEASFLACLASLCGVEPAVAAPAAALYVSLAGGGEAEEGAIVAFAVTSALLPRVEWSVDMLPGAVSLLYRDDGLGAALFYTLLSMRSRSYTPRMGYRLPDVTTPSAAIEVLESGVTLGDVLGAAGETSIVYRDIVEGFVRSLELSQLPPDEAISEAVTVYARDSGVLRRRGCRGDEPGGRDAWWRALESRCTPGDAVDLGLLASFLGLLRKLYPALLDSEGYAVEGLCEELRSLLEDVLEWLNPLLSLSLSKRV